MSQPISSATVGNYPALLADIKYSSIWQRPVAKLSDQPGTHGAIGPRTVAQLERGASVAPKGQLPVAQLHGQPPAPTGRNMSAQGKARSAAVLGHSSQNSSSPEGAKEGGEQLPKPLDELNEVLAAW